MDGGRSKLVSTVPYSRVLQTKMLMMSFNIPTRVPSHVPSMTALLGIHTVERTGMRAVYCRSRLY